jgi:hypothetical protein
MNHAKEYLRVLTELNNGTEWINDTIHTFA